MVPLQQQGVELPWPTQVLLSLADFLGAWWWLLLGLAAGGYFAWRSWSRLPANRRIVDGFLLKIPVLGTLLRDIAVARFTRTLGTLSSAGVPILGALAIVRDTLGNTVMMDAIDEVRERVTTGGSLATPLERCGQCATRGLKRGRRTGPVLAARDARTGGARTAAGGPGANRTRRVGESRAGGGSTQDLH